METETRNTEHATVEGRDSAHLRHLLDKAVERGGMTEARRAELIAAAKRGAILRTPTPRRTDTGLDAVAALHRGRQLLAERRVAIKAGRPVPTLTPAGVRLLGAAMDEECRLERSLPPRRFRA